MVTNRQIFCALLAYHIGMPLSCEMVLVKKLELEATELNLKNNNHKAYTPAVVYK
jgi:hypothetical protein